MATEKLRSPDIALAYVEGHSRYPHLGYAIAHLVKDLQAKIAALTTRLDEFEGRLGFLTARHNRVIEPAATRLNALEKRQKELAEWIGQQGEGFYDAREERDALAARLDALDARVVELEGPLLVFPAVRGEWVRRNGLIPVFDLDEKEEGGK